jgi:hypothetical protein
VHGELKRRERVNRVILIKLHMLLAAFIFPVAFMFMVTGGLYTWGIKGAYQSESHLVNLAQPLEGEQAELVAIVTTELQRRSITPPSGAAKIKRGGTSFKLEWTGARRDVELEPTKDPLKATLTIKETSWYRNLVQLHKAKGGVMFKIYAATLAVSLFIILLSGFLMAWQVPKYRSVSLLAGLAGIFVFIGMLFAS